MSVARISEKQLRRFYFPSWSKCARANGWVMEKGRLRERENGESVSGGNVVDQLRAQVWRAGWALAVQGHRAVTAEDLRHGCTVVALGRYKSSKDLTNGELDRVVTLMRLLTEPDDVGAMLDWENPERGERKRLLWAIEKAAPEAYIAAISSDRFGSELWQELPAPELRQILMTLKNRQKKWNAEGRGQRSEVRDRKKPEPANCPF